LNDNLALRNMLSSRAYIVLAPSSWFGYVYPEKARVLNEPWWIKLDADLLYIKINFFFVTSMIHEHD
jgi:hypothetical protein